jgi:RsiW-degrading membrane proteinase PrsW (M82 family)
VIDKRAATSAPVWTLESDRPGVTAVPLAAGSSVTFGRDDTCDVVFDTSFAGISRKHATVFADAAGLRVTDLGSSNGTYINGSRIGGTRPLQAGDRLALSDDVTFTVRKIAAQAKIVRPGGAVTASPRLVSDLLPFLSRSDKGTSLRRYLFPAILIAFGIVLLFITGASPNQDTFLYVLAGFLGIGALVIVDALANHPRAWWILGLSALATACVLLWPNSPIVAFDFYIFRHVLPGAPTPDAPPSLHSFISYFFGAGCAEELLKALPVLIAAFLLRKRGFGPLDGLMIGAASGLGFTLVETLLEYVPDAVAHANQVNGAIAGAFVGVELEIPRLLGAITGHMAWAGYVGYAIGAAARTPDPGRRWQLVLGAYFVAALLHAAWDTVDLGGPVTVAISTAIGVVSFLLLASAASRGRLAAANAEPAAK